MPYEKSEDGVDQPGQKSAAPKHQKKQAKHAHHVVNPKHSGGQKMTHHVTAIERRNRDEVENAEHDIDDHQFVNTSLHNGTRSELVSAKLEPWSVPKTICSPSGRSSLHQDQNQHGASRNHKIADRSDHRSENVVEHGILEVSRIDRRRFGPAEHGKVSEHRNRRQQQGSEQDQCA